MNEIDIINGIDYAITLNGDKNVIVRELKLRTNKNSYFLVEISNVHFLENRIKFTSAKKALNHFFDLCLEMNLSTYNYSYEKTN